MAVGNVSDSQFNIYPPMNDKLYLKETYRHIILVCSYSY